MSAQLTQVLRLRSLGWSDLSIARHLSLPLDAVRNVLGITVYDRSGLPVAPVAVIVEGIARPDHDRPSERVERLPVVRRPAVSHVGTRARGSRVDIKRCMQMQRNGATLREIGAAMGVSSVTVFNAIARARGRCVSEAAE